MSTEQDYDESQEPTDEDIAAEMAAFEEMAEHFGQTFPQE